MKLLIIFLAFLDCTPKEETVRISKTYDVTSPEKLLVMVNNVNGSVNVEPSTSGKVELELIIEIDASSASELAKAKRELQLGEYQSEDSLIFYTKAPFIRDCDKPPFLGGNWNNGPDYSFSYEYTLRIPKSSNAYMKTVNKGKVVIRDVEGDLQAWNINGDVEIQGAHKVLKASTVNGDVTINFLKSPSNSINFHTVNGDFNLSFPDDLAAKLYFDTMHGDMFSAFDFESLSPKVEVNKSSNGSKFKIGSKTGVEIGSGGPELSFKSINGNVYIKKSK